MKKKIYIVSPTTGVIQTIYETKNFFIYKKKIIINSKKNIIVSPSNGKIKNDFSKKINFIIQYDPNIHILITNKFKKNTYKKINIIPTNLNNYNICTGEIIFMINYLNNNKHNYEYQTIIEIYSTKKIKKTKNSLIQVQAGTTILSSI
ncbi:PTS system glucose-specific EIIA component [Buchnera aphidicola (Cinara cuneomaculata)]|uniref:PTS system glucose-specific EIIA component n=2 Tax=Buchnera aphidicola TaxID=9 RepID=A0A451CXP6_9GAMM|nr:PTS system glucose-specific EIIA component [Buchnera aphidicola (Cinara cuneomaculata)]